jgi:hypothetical protein
MASSPEPHQITQLTFRTVSIEKGIEKRGRKRGRRIYLKGESQSAEQLI